MKISCTLGLLAVAVLTLNGCATQLKTLPLQPVLAQSTPAPDVELYFGSQEHRAVKSQIAIGDESARIGRLKDGAEASCNAALSEALQKLRSYARDHHGNAVINIKTNFHGTQTASSSDFTCGVSTSAAALHVSGDVVVLEAK